MFLSTPWMVTLVTGLLCLWVLQNIKYLNPPNTTSQTQTSAYSLLTADKATSAKLPYELDLLLLEDYKRLMNLSNFFFNMLSNACYVTSYDIQPPLLLVLVHSAPSNVEQRSVIRATWGGPRDSMRLVFLLGTVPTPRLQHLLDNEQERHGDLVQGSFRDTYRNLTYKHVMTLKFATYYCPLARYVLKVDDDVFVNMPAVMAYLRVELSKWGARRLLFCNVLRVRNPMRSYSSKWQVTFKEYSARQYPPYCSGWWILYSPDVVYALYREAQRAEYFWIDDLLVTGILAARAGVQHTQVDRALMLEANTMARLLQANNSVPPANYSFLYGRFNINSDDIRALWKAVDNDHQNRHSTTAVASAALASDSGAATKHLD